MGRTVIRIITLIYTAPARSRTVSRIITFIATAPASTVSRISALRTVKRISTLTALNQ